MAAQEFELIDRFFKNHRHCRSDVLVGIGDDGAVMSLPEGQSLVVAVDTLVEGVHFPQQTLACDIAYKSLAVNLSDLAAMGAVPAWATLALTLPSSDDVWLADFSRGFFELADQYNVALVGGDTTCGALTLSVQLQGWLDPKNVLKRSTANAGDLIYVSGSIGDAGLGLLVQQGKVEVAEVDRKLLLARLNRPQARVDLGQALVGIASAAIDVSDGLAADLGHILAGSALGAELELAAIPRSSAFMNSHQALVDWLCRQREIKTNWDDIDFAISAGDDYELCFTVPPSKQSLIEGIADDLDLPLSLIGRVMEGQGLVVIDADKKQIEAAAECGAPVIEIHTGHFSDAETAQEKDEEYQRIIQAVEYADSLGLHVNAGHGLHYHNVKEIAVIPLIQELNIGHAIIARSIFTGLEAAVKEMKALMDSVRT